MMSIRVLVADDHSMVRQGMRMYFDGDPDVTIVGEARNGEEALDIARDIRPDVVLMDLLMPAMDGVEATRQLRRSLPRAHIVAMTSVVEESGVHRAIEAGAIGYVLKDTRPDELREAVLAAAEGRVRFAPESAGRLMRDVPTPDANPGALSDEDRELLSLLAQERSTVEIARTMGLEQGEVETRLEALLQRLGLAGPAHAVLYATRQGLVPAGLRPYLS
jgi:two-component system, NarL family, response regulator LiaR